MRKTLVLHNPKVSDAFSDAVKDADAVVVPLTATQNKVIWCMQGNYIAVCGENHVEISAGLHKTFQVSSALFFKLVSMGLIYQEQAHPYDYILTYLGRKAITKTVLKI